MTGITTINETIFFSPTKECADWCIDNYSRASYNIPVISFIFIVLSLLMLYISEYLIANSNSKQALIFISYAKYLIYIGGFVFLYMKTQNILYIP